MKKTVSDLAKFLQLKDADNLPKDILVTGVSFDTRTLKKGDLFVPLVDGNDGHKFIHQAIEKGAVATLWSNDKSEAPTAIPVLFVSDTLIALQDLAKAYLASVAPKVVAITGSNGKTTTKDMTAAVLASQYKVHKTNGNFNNHIGVPVTILEMPEDTTHLILEMGMNHAGELTVLSDIGTPDIAVITMIGDAHIEFFGTRGKIADAKMEIVHGLKAKGTFIYNGDEPLLRERATQVTQTQKTFGLEPSNDLFAENIQVEKYETSFTVPNLASEIFTIPVLGAYNVSNALAALSVGQELGISVENAKNALANFKLTAKRTEWLKTSTGIDVLSDVYNANPTAIKSVLDVFSETQCDGRRAVILGDMLELGEQSKSLHESVAAHLSPERITFVFLYGQEMQALYSLLQEKYPGNQLFYFPITQKVDLLKKVKATLQSGDSVLVKGSAGMKLSEVVTDLYK